MSIYEKAQGYLAAIEDFGMYKDDKYLFLALYSFLSRKGFIPTEITKTIAKITDNPEDYVNYLINEDRRDL